MWLLQNSNKHQFLLLPMSGNPKIEGMQGRKNHTEKLFLSFRLSDRIPNENLYRRLRETLDLSFLYRDTKELYGRTGNPSIDPVVFFKLLITGYLENITSDRKLVEHCGMRMDVLYFLGHDLDEELPWQWIPRKGPSRISKRTLPTAGTASS